MGESKLPKPPMERPSVAIFAMKAAVEASKGQLMILDADTKDFMADLSRLVDWIDHLEAEKPPETTD